MSRPPVTIVMPCRDRPDDLDATLTGVTRQLRAEDSLLVVDSASRDATAMADVARRHGVSLVRLEVPGASRARNAGWQLADTDIVIFVDDTVVVTDGWLDALVEPLVRDPHLGFVAGRIEPIGDGSRRAPVAVHSHPAPRAVEPGDPAPGDSASLAVRTSALRQVGGFDERLGPGTWFAAADDLNLLDRVLLSGWPGRYEPAARAGSPQPEDAREHVAKIWAYGKASGGRLALLARQDRRLARLVAPQVLPGLRRRAGMAGDPADEVRPPRSPLLALVRAAGTVAGFAAGLVLLRTPAPPTEPRAPCDTALSEQMSVSVVIATRGRVALLRECLDRLRPQLRDGDEIVIVDDDPAGSAAATFGDIDRRISVIRSNGTGPATARNRGIRAARGDIVAFTDDDVLPADTWLQALRESLATDPCAVGVEGPIVSDPFDMVFVHSVASDGPGAYYTANVAYRADAVKGEEFDEGFAFPYGEDLDLAFRLLRHGSIRFDERMTVRHRPRLLPLREFWHRGRFVVCDWVLYRRYPEFAPPRLPMRWKPASRRVIEWVKKLRDVLFGRTADTNHGRLAVLGRAALGGGLEVARALIVTLTQWHPEPGDAAAAERAAATLVKVRGR